MEGEEVRQRVNVRRARSLLFYRRGQLQLQEASDTRTSCGHHQS